MATAASQPADATAETLDQLKAARKLSLQNAAYYAQIVHGVVPLVGVGATLDLQRWGADFLAETLGTPVLGMEEKTKIALKVLSLLREYLDVGRQDEWVLKSTIQAAASAYPLIFKYIIDHPTESAIWQQMTAIKSSILRRMDTSLPGVHVCCIKFVQRVVQTQTPGLIADPRNSEANEISLALVPRDHPVIPPPNLEAEASGLLDRLLGLLQENNSDALLVTATLNSLGSLIRTRASVANKVLTAVLNFDPFKLARSPITPKSRVLIRSLEKTTKQLLIFVMRKMQTHPLAGRIDQYLQRMSQSRAELLDERNRKRPAPAEPIDGLDASKRQRLAAQPADQAQWPPPLPPGPVSVAQLFTLTDDPGSRNFDVKALPPDLVLRILVPLLHSTDANRMNLNVNAVRARWLHLTDPSVQTGINTQPSRVPMDEDDDEYEPDYMPTEDAEQINNRLDQDASAVDAAPQEVTLGPFRLPSPPPLSGNELVDWSKSTIDRLFELMASQEESSKKTQQSGGFFNRIAARNMDRDAWVTIISRIATRAFAGLEAAPDTIKREGMTDGDLVPDRKLNFSMADYIREAFVLYVVQDFRRRIDISISWLNEEWYSDSIQRMEYDKRTRDRDDHFAGGAAAVVPEPVPHYDKWLLRMLDGFLPYLDAKDKILIRFLSEVPTLPPIVIDRVKKLARDPERVTLATNALHYLIMLKPPVRDLCLEAVEDMWRNYSDAKLAAAKILTKWRPHVLQEAANGVVKVEGKHEIAAA